MKLLNYLAPLALAALGVQADWQPWGSDGCLTTAQVNYIVANSITFLSHEDVAAANASAQAIFAPDIVEFGDSINSLRGDAVSHALQKQGYD